MLGFVSGLPFLLTLSTLSYWLAEVGIDNTTIGLFMLVSLPYSFKFLWAPLIDHIPIPLMTRFLGQRRSWLMAMQGGLLISLYFLGLSNPAINIGYTALSAFFVSFFSASQDITIDAYRIETISPQYRGSAAALETIGFRFGMLASGAGALYLAALFDWKAAYMLMTTAVGGSLILILFLKEPPRHCDEHTEEIREEEGGVVSPLDTSWRGHGHPSKIRSLKSKILLPLYEFAHRDKILLIVLFIFCFKLADTVMNAMSAPFLCDIGFSKIEFANVSKLFGITLMVIGGLLGGVIIHRMGIYQSAILCAVLQTLSCLMFTIQAIVGYDPTILMITVGVESLCSGMTSTIFIAFLSEFCSKPHTATHFSTLYSLGSLSRAITSAGSGWLADSLGWSTLFFLASMTLFPTLFFLTRLSEVKVKEVG
jgi:PAT family beta-lactamase induction signal transducer AmpG